MTLNVEIGRPVGAVLLLLAVGLVGMGALATAWVSCAALSDERDAKAAFVQKSLAAGRPSAGAAAEPDRPLSVEADSDTLAAARIEALIRATVTAAGGAVLSSRAETRPGELVGDRDERIEIQAVVQGRIEALQAALYRLESGRPLVLVDELSLRPVEGGPVGEAAQAPTLAATLTLSAFWAQPAPDKKGPGPVSQPGP